MDGPEPIRARGERDCVVPVSARSEHDCVVPVSARSEHDCVVLGAGITGLVSAAILARQGAGRVLVVDSYGHLGGNHIDRTHGGFTFDVGSFIFQDDSPLLAHFPDLLPLYVPIEPTFGRLTPQRRVSQYPISVRDDLLGAGPVELARILASAAKARMFHRRIPHAQAFARYWVGERLLRRSGLENYMRRFYGVPPETIDTDFAQARMLWIKTNAMVRTHIQRMIRPGPRGPTNRQLARPREGFGHLYDVARRRLEAAGVTFLLGARVSRISRPEGRFVLETDSGMLSASRLVSTIPIPEVQAMCGLPQSSSLRTVTMVTLFFSFEGRRGFPHSILFNFSDDGAWKRITMHSDFYGRTEGREFFCVEVNTQGAVQDAAAAADDFRRHVRANGLFDGDLRLEGDHMLANAYPIFTGGTSAQAAEAIKALRDFGVESFGRQGGFDYLPTARAATVITERALLKQA